MTGCDPSVCQEDERVFNWRGGLLGPDTALASALYAPLDSLTPPAGYASRQACRTARQSSLHIDPIGHPCRRVDETGAHDGHAAGRWFATLDDWDVHRVDQQLAGLW